MRVRVEVIYQWLYALKHLNPLYSHVTVEDTPSTRKLLEGIPDQLLGNAVISEDPATEELFRRSTSDVAQLVSSSEDEERVATQCNYQAKRRPHPREGHQTGGGLNEPQVPSDRMEGDVSDCESSPSELSDSEQAEAEIDSLNDVEGHQAREMVSTLMPILITDSASDLNGQGVNPSVELIAAVKKAFGSDLSDQRDSEKDQALENSRRNDESSESESDAIQRLKPTTVKSECSASKPSTTASSSSDPPSRVACRFDESNLINEFTDNDLIIYGTCPHLFLLGKGLQGRKGSINQNLTNLLMRFFDSRFERDHRLIFLLFNQLQRHEAARAVSQLGVKNCSKSIKDVIDYVTSTTFQAELTEAVAKPDGKASKKIQRILGPHLRVAGGHIPYSPSARAKCLSELYAMVNYLGLPSFFVTISPSDLDAVLIFELCKGPQLNKSSSSLKGSESTIHVPLPGLADRAKLLAENPGHAAAVFHHLMESVSSALYRLDMEHGRRKSNPPVSQRECSILGIPVGY